MAKRSASTDMQDLVVLVYDEVVDVIKTKEIDTEALLSVAFKSIGVVQRISEGEEIPKPERKQIVISVVKKVVEDLVEDEERVAFLNSFIEATLPSLIDRLVSAAKGHLFPAIGKAFKRCCK